MGGQSAHHARRRAPLALITAAIRPESGGPTPASNARLRGHSRGHFRTKQDLEPACFIACFTGSTHVVLVTPWHRYGSLAYSRTALSAFGRRVGLGATPRRTDVLRPKNPALVTPVVSCSGSLPARACGASDPCGKAYGPPAAGPGEGQWSLRRPALAGGVTIPVTVTRVTSESGDHGKLAVIRRCWRSWRA